MSAEEQNQLSFQELFVRQMSLQTAKGIDTTTSEFLREQTLALIVEAGEAVSNYDWKTWKKSYSDINLFAEELVDVQLFLMNLLIFSGFSPAQFLEMCAKKQQKNHSRIREQ